MERELDIIRQLDDQEAVLQRARLRTMQLVALGLLLLAALLFALARAQRHGHPAWGYLEAFSEAAMIGAIADWFAVVALFRHPLGVPLWHTAIIPNSKDRIGKSLGKFVENHFITEAAINARLREVDIAGKAGRYLQDPAHAERLTRWTGPALEQLLQSLDQDRMRRLVCDTAARELARLDLASLAGDCVDALIAEDQPQHLVDLLLDQLGEYLSDEGNHETIGNVVQSAVNTDSSVVEYALHKAMPRLIRSTIRKVADVRVDRQHPLRARLGAWIADSALRLKADPQWQAAIARFQHDALASDKVRHMLEGLWDALRSRVQAELHSAAPGVPGRIPAGLQTLVQNAGRMLAENQAMREGLNRLLEAGSAQLVRNYRGEVGLFIETQLARWTRDEMSNRIELAIGRDLQFIRINGTVVGGVAGLLIHVIVQYTV
ncbi:hypothetical protein ASF61_20875 [Duganella sp. Leaf126]|uniref:DUF445 domain-containing protein n=1 Tax=Duganella sp. Leaf126 TaxID=1736266 RepID=UPI0006FF904F|nr:DUF445 domain-containing protein [Duganella sp. Leaf126]KQQ45090.1 hypothetical protein ASF61_20875 [Duganella sp. Leaf126]